MDFQVLPPRTAPNYDSEDSFALIQNNWNDYSFETQYSLVYLGPASKRGHNLIGTVKILKRGQTEKDTLQITKDFNALDGNFISVGQSLDYYQRLSALSEDLRIKALESLNDFVHNPSFGHEFRAEPGWKTSLFRDFSENDSFLLTATSLLNKKFEGLLDSDLKFAFHVTGWDQSINFDYSLPDFVNRVSGISHPIPNRIISLIGRNGCGKSTLLARLARIAYATTKDRNSLNFLTAGKITPEGIGFPRIITVSYSAFDSFRLPGIKPELEGEPDERLQIIKDLEEGGGRFIFCGLRDIATELKITIESESDNTLSPLISDKVKTTLLKPVDRLAKEFYDTLIIVKTNGASHILDRALNCISSDASFSSFKHILTTQKLLENDPINLFIDWSTGHKIVMQILTNLAAHTTQSSLILIDEPETHLHPPLLAALMHAVRILLNIKKAFAIVATHSPVVLQESLKTHTFIIRREGSKTTIAQPQKETFGENIGALTGDIFGLDSTVTDFHTILDRLIDEFKSVKTIEYFFQPDGLSMQARAYVMSQLASKGLL